MTFFLSSKSLNYPKQDVRDCLTAIDHVINEKLIDASKVAVVGISHGGFLTTHLIGQVGILIDFRVIAVALSVLVPSTICNLDAGSRQICRGSCSESCVQPCADDWHH